MKNLSSKLLDFPLYVLLIEISRCILSSFLIFESRDWTIWSGKNLPIASEIINVKSSFMYSILYIICKHFLSWFQKYIIYWILLNPSIFMKIFDLSGENDNFRQKQDKLVMWHIISQQIKYLWPHNYFRAKISFVATTSSEIWNF